MQLCVPHPGSFIVLEELCGLAKYANHLARKKAEEILSLRVITLSPVQQEIWPSKLTTSDRSCERTGHSLQSCLYCKSLPLKSEQGQR